MVGTANPPPEQSLVGAILSRRFRLTRELGRGGMGVVYAASTVEGGASVAIKILHAHFLGDRNVLQRFLDEGRTYTRLVHANILRAHECLTAEDGSPYLVMELLDGVPLSAYTRNGGRVSVAHAVPILQGILAGLEAAHESGVVHRDLKPANVFLARDRGGLFAVKLLDFGIAKVMELAGGMGKKTRTGVLLGTPAYMSPEQIRSAKDVDGRSDLWSAGVMFYEMLAGRAAFPAPTDYARLVAVMQTVPEPIEAVDPQLAGFGPFFLRAMQKDPELRFQSAREMALALGAVANASGDPGSRVAPLPLSRLPDHLWASPSAPDSRVVDEGPPTPAPAARSPSIPASAHPPQGDADAVRHDDTLASASPPASSGETLSSAPSSRRKVVATLAAEQRSPRAAAPARAPSGERRTGVRLWVVVMLVLVALVLGAAAGYAYGSGLIGLTESRL